MKTRETGNVGETAAVKFLRRKHYRILARNYRFGHYELDIVAANRKEIAFVEVKTRSVTSPDGDMPYGRPAEAVDKAKMKNTVAAARGYLSERPDRRQPRFDVMEVYLDKNSEKPRVLLINHIENAFTKGSNSV